nr:MFS transporter [Micromonospora sp. NBRC 107566]
MSSEVRATQRPATFREVFASREFGALYLASAISWFGDYLARAAVTGLVYEKTSSVALSAATFALSYAPWIVGGPFLAALAERLPFRRVMVFCDVLRMLLISAVALPFLPIPALLGLLFLTALLNPPAQAARSALIPVLLTGDRLVVGLALNITTGQIAQFTGYAVGSLLVPVNPRLALIVDGFTFLISAVLLRVGLREHPSLLPAEEERHLLRDTVDGFRVVFGTRILRAIAILVFSSMLVAAVPDGLAAAWAAEVSSDGARGVSQSVIMAAHHVGYVLAGLIIGRLVRPAMRRSLIRPFAVLAPLALVPAVLNPPVAGIALMSACCGFATAGMLPAANGLFVQVLPAAYRARAFGVMQSGVQIMQGVGVMATGLLADRLSLPMVVGLWSLAGVALILAASLNWPSASSIEHAITTNAQLNEAAAAPAQPVPAAGHAVTGAIPSAAAGEAARPATGGVSL